MRRGLVILLWAAALLAAPGAWAQGTEPELTDDEAAAVGLASLCCCFLFLVGLVVLVVALVKKSGRPSASGATGVAPPPPNPYARVQPPLTHLSVLAVAFDARRRQQVEGAVRAKVAGSPVTQEQRAELVRALCGALLEVSSNWRAFGYGDKTDFADDRAAETSFRAAWSDFKGRCAGPGEAGGELCVAVLVLCSRGELLGTTRLDDPEQARALVQHRLGAAPGSLLAADCFFAPASADQGALSTGDAYRRFPEMQPLAPPAARP